MESNVILFSDCILTKGYNRSIISDTQNKRYFYIPNGLYEILSKYNGFKISTIKEKFNNEFDEIIDEYFHFLIENKLVFFNDTIDFFPKIQLDFFSNAKITNVIVDFDLIKHDLNSLLDQFETLKCSYLQLRFYKEITLNEIEEYVNLFRIHQSPIKSISIIAPFYEEFTIDDIKPLFFENQRLDTLLLYNAPNEVAYNELFYKRGHIVLKTKNIINEHNCGIVSLEYLNPSLKLISESQKFNSCLNLKVSIDKEGYIRNCPSMPEHFGNISKITLIEAINHPDFKKYWSVSKDEVQVCKDCEFRHICTDCRAYTERTHFKEDIDLSKPLKCGYNPYSNKWEDWSTNPLKQKAIQYYGLQELING